MQDTQFNSIITIMYFLDIIERGPVLLFLWNKFAGRLHYKGKKCEMDSLLYNK